MDLSEHPYYFTPVVACEVAAAVWPPKPHNQPTYADYAAAGMWLWEWVFNRNCRNKLIETFVLLPHVLW